MSIFSSDKSAAGAAVTAQPDDTFFRRLAAAFLALEWLFLALFLPLLWNVGDGAAMALLAIPLFWTVRRLATGHFVPATPFNLTVLLLLLVVLAGTQTTVDQALSRPPAVRVIYGVAVFYAAVAAAGRSPRHFAAALALYLSMGVAIAAVALFATGWQAKLPLVSHFIPLLPQQLDLFNPNYLAGVLLWFAPLSLALTVALPLLFGAVRRQAGVVAAAGVALALLGNSALFLLILLLTQSRSGLLGLAAALLFIVLVFLLRRPRMLLPATLTVAIVAILVLRYTPATFWRELAGLAPIADIRVPATYDLSNRLEIWQRALLLIEDFPFTGAGMGTFERIVPLLYPYRASGDTAIPHAHNQLLHLAAELGIPGLLAYLALWISAGLLLLAIWRRRPPPPYRVLALGFAASLLGFFIHGLAEAVPLGDRPSFIFWALLGLVVALHHIVSSQPAGAPPTPANSLITP